MEDRIVGYLKTVTVYANNGAGAESASVRVSVSADGKFYGYVPDRMIEASKSVFTGNYSGKDGKVKVFSKTLSELEDKLREALAISITPDIKEEHVIRYIIESHVAFAEDSEGNVFPNSGFEGAEWVKDDDMYGNHYSNRPVPGYSLCIGAAAYTKTTTTFGDRKKVKYRLYYKDGSHHGRENPAELLNSWTCIDPPGTAKEIPYSDDAALFFHNLLLGMARIAKIIQSRTFDQENLLELIKSGESPLALSAPSSKGG